MNTNSNTYTVIYTTIVVVLVAAILAFVSQKLGPMQAANEKAETVSQILTAAQFGDEEKWQKMGNAATIKFFEENISGSKTVLSTSNLKALNYKIKAGKDIDFPKYVFKNGITVLPVYGAGLWGPVWGYIAVAEDGLTIVGTYFDHASETPGLGGKIKDDPSFRDEFKKEKLNINSIDNPFDIVKGGSEKDNFDDSQVDAITGATMTSKGLDAAIDVWMGAYLKSVEIAPVAAEGELKAMEETSNE